jgi:PEP-CTERM motif
VNGRYGLRRDKSMSFAAGSKNLAADFAGLDGGRGYFIINSSFSPAGEIRGFLHRVPEPGTLMLLGLGLIAMGLVRVKRRDWTPSCRRAALGAESRGASAAPL